MLKKIKDKLKKSKIGAKFKAIPLWMMISLVAVIAVGFGGFQFYKAQKLNKQISEIQNDPQKVVDDQTKEVIDKVSKLMILPTDETPTLATVSDPEKLKDQAFFAKAKLGFKVLIYANAQKAILYDPEANIIVEVAPVNVGTDNPNPNLPLPQIAGENVVDFGPDYKVDPIVQP